MNNVILMGRLTRDPEMRYVQFGSTQSAVVRFTIAVDRQLSREKRAEKEARNESSADFISVVCWGKLAENVSRFTGKGNRILVQGRIQTGSYEKDGQRVYTTEVVASNVQFLDWKDSGRADSGMTNYQPGPFGDSADDFQYGADFDPISDEGRIPF